MAYTDRLFLHRVWLSTPCPLFARHPPLEPAVLFIRPPCNPPPSRSPTPLSTSHYLASFVVPPLPLEPPFPFRLPPLFLYPPPFRFSILLSTSPFCYTSPLSYLLPPLIPSPSHVPYPFDSPPPLQFPSSLLPPSPLRTLPILLPTPPWLSLAISLFTVLLPVSRLTPLHSTPSPPLPRRSRCSNLFRENPKVLLKGFIEPATDEWRVPFKRAA